MLYAEERWLQVLNFLLFFYIESKRLYLYWKKYHELDIFFQSFDIYIFIKRKN